MHAAATRQQRHGTGCRQQRLQRAARPRPCTLARPARRAQLLLPAVAAAFPPCAALCLLCLLCLRPARLQRRFIWGRAACNPTQALPLPAHRVSRLYIDGACSNYRNNLQSQGWGCNGNPHGVAVHGSNASCEAALRDGQNDWWTAVRPNAAGQSEGGGKRARQLEVLAGMQVQCLGCGQVPAQLNGCLPASMSTCFPARKLVHALLLVPAGASEALLCAAFRATHHPNQPPSLILASTCMHHSPHADTVWYDGFAMCATSPIGYFYIHNSCNQTVSFTLTVSVSDSVRTVRRPTSELCCCICTAALQLPIPMLAPLPPARLGGCCCLLSFSACQP